MPFPFPGMNPYLEHPELWPEVHHLLMGLLAETLNPQLLPTYRAAIEKRVYELSGEEAVLIGIPADLYAFNLEDAVPTFALPLVNEATEPRIDLYALLNQAYNRAGYAVAIDYTVDPVPPLGPEKAAWVDSLLHSQGLR
ncbi:MAG: DUF4058 family protein [Leptolyngbyaceae cyanobacterium SM2_5_2]|nr:DUF4058 family protein [Leptolyngbyaceae cyanobacterium SM2_5_2]